jgi:hypothetical protein
VDPQAPKLLRSDLGPPAVAAPRCAAPTTRATPPQSSAANPSQSCGQTSPHLTFSQSSLTRALASAESRRHRHQTTILGVRQYQPIGDRMSPVGSSDLHDNALSASKCPPGSGYSGRDVVAHHPAELGMRIKLGVRCRSTHPAQGHHSWVTSPNPIARPVPAPD